MCYFSGEHIALSINENFNGVNIALGKNNRLKALCMMQINIWNKQTMCQKKQDKIWKWKAFA